MNLSSWICFDTDFYPTQKPAKSKLFYKTLTLSTCFGHPKVLDQFAPGCSVLFQNTITPGSFSHFFVQVSSHRLLFAERAIELEIEARQWTMGWPNLVVWSPGERLWKARRASVLHRMEIWKEKKHNRENITDWWFGTWLLFFHILGMSSSQLTCIFFRGVGQPPTR